LQPDKSSFKQQSVEAPTTELPPELDFFKYTKRNLNERKGQPSHSIKPSRDEESSESPFKKRKLEQEQPNGKQKIVTKGFKVPAIAETFSSLQERYGFSQRLIQNLNAYGYVFPTGIQSQGCPIMLEVQGVHYDTNTNSTERHFSIVIW
jgi:ATP-dependent RNA helicase DDX52/ROK1